jgi:heat shock protein HslJ
MKWLCGALFVMAMAACAQQAPSAQPGVTNAMPSLNQTWTMIGSAMMSNPPTITFEGNRASGFTGCNQWGGDVVFGKNNALRFENGVQTEMACMDAAMAAEQEFNEILPRVRAYAFNEQGALVLKDESGAIVMALDNQQQ